jgi:general nucleoside transport system permease protein
MNATMRKVVGAFAAPVVALLVAVLVTSLVLTLAGAPVGEFWTTMLSPPKPRNWVNIMNQASMIFLSAMAAAIGFRMNLFNIGVEGQYTLASYAAAVFAGAALLPGMLNILGTIFVAMAVGAAWAGLAGLLKVTRGVSEVISTIMLNAIAITLVGIALNKYGEDIGNSVRTTPIDEGSMLSGWSPFADRDGALWTLNLLAVSVGLGMWFLINRTRFGFDLRAAGQNESAAVASGVKVNRMVVSAMLISGAIAGLIWLPALFGDASYYGSTFQKGLGFIGIAVALLGRNRPVGVAVGALLFAWLNEQANPLGLLVGISPSVVQITQGFVVLAVVIAYELVRRWLATAEQRALKDELETRHSKPREVVT